MNFNLLNKDSNIHEEYVVIEDISHYDREIDDPHYDNHSIDAFDIVPNASIILGCHEDQIVPFENLKDDEQIDISACEQYFESAADTKGSNHEEKEQGDIFPNLFQDFIVDTSIQEASSLSLGSYLDAPIFDQYSDEEEDFKICEDLLSTKFHLVLLFSREMIKMCACCD
jgi:hypothetical protein